MVKPSTPQTPPPAHAAPSTHAAPDLASGLTAPERSPASLPPTVKGPPFDARAVTVCIPADAEFVIVVRLAVTGVATRMKFSFDQIEEIKLAVTEACNNAILHARPAVPDRPLTVAVQLIPGEEHLEIWVTDEGHVPPPGLPVRHAATEMSGERFDDGVNVANTTVTSESADVTGSGPTGSGAAGGYDALSELPEGGLGLLLIQKLMDEVEHFTGADHHTSVRMVKRIHGGIRATA